MSVQFRSSSALIITLVLLCTVLFIIGLAVASAGMVAAKPQGSGDPVPAGDIEKPGEAGIEEGMAGELDGVDSGDRVPPVITGNGVAVLTLHEVAHGHNDYRYVVAPDVLERMIVTAREAGYVFISLYEFHAYMDGKAGVPDRAVLLTFDDGYRGVYENGHNIFVRHKCPAVMFPVTKWYSKHPRPEWARPHLTAEESKAMIGSGFWGFGGHSHDGHRTVVTGPNGQQGFFSTERMWLGQGRIESEGEYRARLWSDIELMTLELSRLGVEPRDFTAPYGKINGTLDKLLADAGYDFVYIGGTERNYPGQRKIYRVDAGDTVESFMETLDILWGKKAGQLTPAA